MPAIVNMDVNKRVSRKVKVKESSLPYRIWYAPNSPFKISGTPQLRDTEVAVRLATLKLLGGEGANIRESKQHVQLKITTGI